MDSLSSHNTLSHKNQLPYYKKLRQVQRCQAFASLEAAYIQILLPKHIIENDHSKIKEKSSQPIKLNSQCQCAHGQFALRRTNSLFVFFFLQASIPAVTLTSPGAQRDANIIRKNV
jgi:hypothetical protein